MQLLITTHGTKLTKRGGRIRAENPDGAEEIPVRHITSVLIDANTVLSSSLICSFVNQNIPVTIMDRSVPKTTIDRYPSKSFTDMTLRQAKIDGLAIAKRIILAAMLNKNRILAQKELALAIPAKDLQSAGSPNELMGIEGSFTREYFSMLKSVANADFDGRNRRPPRDLFNAALSYGYAILESKVAHEILSAGLNPHLGVLHLTRRGNALVYDLMEEFRQPIVDKTAIKLFNLKMLTGEHAVKKGEGGVFLSEKGKFILVQELSRKFDEAVSGRNAETYLGAIKRQVQRFKACVFTGGEYEPFMQPSR